MTGNKFNLGPPQVERRGRDVDDGVIRLALLGNLRDGDFEHAARLATDGILPTAGLSLNWHDDAIGMGRESDHALSP
jgi:hypothetical protein